MTARLSELEVLLSEGDIWNDPERAQALLKEQKDLEKHMERLAIPTRVVEDVSDFIEMAELENDRSFESEIREMLDRGLKVVEQMETHRMLSGEHDAASAILTINAGAGGTESQDWASMLLRMYLRYCDRQGFSVEELDRQDGDDAGIKSATLEVKGEYAFGLLKSEIGVHRLVRISPFDSSARRHTSFTAVFVYPDIEEDIEIEINENDLRVDTFRASGAGGQHVNKTSSAVRLTHIPSGIVVSCQAERSQHKNRDKAMKILRARLYDREMQSRSEEKQAVEDAKQEISFGSQIRNYVMHPYQMVKDLRTQLETSNVNDVMDGVIEEFVKSYLLSTTENESASA